MAHQLTNPQAYGDAMSRDFAKVVGGFALLLEGLGVEDTPHTLGTPERAARAWWDELCGGLAQAPPDVTAFPSGVDSLVVSCGIPVRSVCAHHMLPFLGTAAIGYIPGNGKILGLSKLSRITDYWSRRPQVQEELTEQIAAAVAEHVMVEGRGGVGVVIRARHMCMEMRGVLHSSDMMTSALRGVLREHAEARAEFLKLCRE